MQIRSKYSVPKVDRPILRKIEYLSAVIPKVDNRRSLKAYKGQFIRGFAEIRSQEAA